MKRALKRLKRTGTRRFLHSSAASLVLAVLAVLGLAGPVAAGEQVPFKGSFAGVASLKVEFPIATVEVSATGNATELGLFTLAIPHTVNLSTGISSGFYEFTAANGDKVFASFKGHVSGIGTPVLSAVEIATILGGTGRFAGATGGFTVERLVYTTTVPRTTIGSFNGTISSPGAAGG